MSTHSSTVVNENGSVNGSVNGTHTPTPSETDRSAVFEFRPCIDIRKGKVTQIVGSSIHDHNRTQSLNNYENTSITTINKNSNSHSNSSDSDNTSSSSEITNFISEHPSSYYANLYKKHRLTGGHII